MEHNTTPVRRPRLSQDEAMALRLAQIRGDAREIDERLDEMSQQVDRLERASWIVNVVAGIAMVTTWVWLLIMIGRAIQSVLHG